MTEPGKVLTTKLLELEKRTGYNIAQHNGQRIFGPPPDWTGPAPQKGCEIFIGKLPREVFEDELVPIFSQIGKIYEMRLMMDFSGSNRGYAFVTYCNRYDASAAVRRLNGYEIRPGRHIGVVKSVDNCRLFVGVLPKNKTKQEVLCEFNKLVEGIKDVILYKNCFDRRLNRGFAFIEFTSHRAAAMARRILLPGTVKIWGQDVMVDWAEPEPDIDDDQMTKVKVLYVRNFLIRTTPETIQNIFETAINNKVERVKKMYDYAFIHFYERQHAEIALDKLQNAEVEGSVIEVQWAKPVDRELYRIQKQTKGNAKFNNSLDYSQTLMLYKQHCDKQEYAKSSKEDEGISSGCGSPEQKSTYINDKDQYIMPSLKLESICKRYAWESPIYEYLKYIDSAGRDFWVCKLELPQVFLPLMSVPRPIGPLITRAYINVQQAHEEAAQLALYSIKMLRSELLQRHTVQQIQPMYTTPMVPTDYLNPIYPTQHAGMTLPMPTLCNMFDNIQLYRP